MLIINQTYEELKKLGEYYLRENFFNKRKLDYNEFIKSGFDDFLILMTSSKINDYFNQIKKVCHIYDYHNFKCVSFDKNLNQLQNEFKLCEHQDKGIFINDQIYIGFYQYYNKENSLLRIIINKDIVIIYILHFDKSYQYGVKSIYYTIPLDLTKDKWIYFIKDENSVVGKTFKYKIDITERGFDK